MTGTVTYVYAITRASNLRGLADVRGVAGAAVRTLTSGELGGYVSTLPDTEFGEQALHEREEDLAWLEQTARDHDRVVQECARVTTIVPLRLATIFANDESVAAQFEGLADAAIELLIELEGRDEWGIKLFAPEDAASDPADTNVTGTAYLQRKRSEHARRVESAEQASRDAAEVFAELAQHAVRARQHRPQDPRLTGDARPMVLNAAFLVDRSRLDAFRGAVSNTAAERPSGTIVLTGPWPAYSFAQLDGS